MAGTDVTPPNASAVPTVNDQVNYTLDNGAVVRCAVLAVENDLSVTLCALTTGNMVGEKIPFGTPNTHGCWSWPQ